MKNTLQGKDKILMTEASRGLNQSRSYSIYIEGNDTPVLIIAEKKSVMKSILRLMGGGKALGRINLTALDQNGTVKFIFRVQSAIDEISMKGSIVSDEKGTPIGRIRWKFGTNGMFDIENMNKEKLYEVGYEERTTYMKKAFTFAKNGQRIAQTGNENSIMDSFKNIFKGGGDKYALQFINMDELTNEDIIFMISGLVHFDIEKDRKR